LSVLQRGTLTIRPQRRSDHVLLLMKHVRVLETRSQQDQKQNMLRRQLIKISERTKVSVFSFHSDLSVSELQPSFEFTIRQRILNVSTSYDTCKRS
jgi:hypothetical protein